MQLQHVEQPFHGQWIAVTLKGDLFQDDNMHVSQYKARLYLEFIADFLLQTRVLLRIDLSCGDGSYTSLSCVPSVALFLSVCSSHTVSDLIYGSI